ncbi:CD63 antigen-like [Argonauta hians]
MKLCTILFISIGFLLMLMSIFGLIGALKKSYQYIATFTVFIVVITTVEIASSTAIFSLRKIASHSISARMLRSESQFVFNGTVTHEWNKIQQRFACCGVHHPTEWYTSLGNGTVPDSCCIHPTFNCGRSYPNKTTLYHRGCSKNILSWMHKRQIYFGTTCNVFGFLQLVGGIFACSLASYIRAGAV